MITTTRYRNGFWMTPCTDRTELALETVPF